MKYQNKSGADSSVHSDESLMICLEDGNEFESGFRRLVFEVETHKNGTMNSVTSRLALSCNDVETRTVREWGDSQRPNLASSFSLGGETPYIISRSWHLSSR